MGRRGLEILPLRDPLRESYTSHIAYSSKAQRNSVAKADRIEAGGFNLVMDTKMLLYGSISSKYCRYEGLQYFLSDDFYLAA